MVSFRIKELSVEKKMTNITNDLLNQKLDFVKDTVEDIKTKLEKNYVNQDQLALTRDKVDRLEKMVYGAVGAIVLGFIGLIFALFKK